MLFFQQLMAVFNQPQSRPGMTTAYDAFSATSEAHQQTQQQQHPAHQVQTQHHQHHPQHSQHHQQQPWYDVSDGAATPPDETSSHRDSRMIGPSIVTTRRVACRITVTAALEIVIIVAMATFEYLLRCCCRRCAKRIVIFTSNTVLVRPHNSLQILKGNLSVYKFSCDIKRVK
jgi:hypothetical protein